MTAPTIPTHNTAVEAQFLAPPNNQGAGSKSKKQAAAEYLAAANDGFAGVEHEVRRHGMHTSPIHAAYVVGRWLRETGRAAPREPRPSRGGLFKVSDMTVRIHWTHVQFPTITREA